MHDRVAVAIGLRFIVVLCAVEAPIEIPAVIPPCGAGHQVNAIAMLAPRLDSFREPPIESVDDRHIGSQVGLIAVGVTGLEAGAFGRLQWIDKSSRQRRVGRNNRAGTHHGDCKRRASHCSDLSSSHRAPAISGVPS